LSLTVTFNKNNPNQLDVVGHLTRDLIAKLSSPAKWFNTPQLNVDLLQVASVDTSGLAWMLVVIEQSKQKNIQITFSNLPDDLVKLAKLSAVDELIPLQN
jgi:phospholipid transport system transporter-binding protein